MDRTARRLGRGSLIDLLVVAGVIAVLVVIVGPAVRTAAGDRKNRAMCANNLRQIGIGCISYMVTGLGPGNRKGFMPHVGGIAMEDERGDVGIAFGLLVRVGEIDDPEVFICPQSRDIPTRLRDGQDVSKFEFHDPDVTSSAEFSYGYIKTMRTDGNSRSSRIMMADRTMGRALGGGETIVCHPNGRNVGRFDGTVDWIPADVELPGGDADVRKGLEGLNLLPLPTADDVREPKPEPVPGPGTRGYYLACEKMAEGMKPYCVARVIATATGTGRDDLEEGAGYAGAAREAFEGALEAYAGAKAELEKAGGDPTAFDPARIGETLERLVGDSSRMEKDLAARIEAMKKAGK